MIIALTGTPGTGKTTICGFMSEHSKYRKQFHIIDLNKLVINEKLHTGKDEKWDTYIADLPKLEERVKQLISQAPEGMDVIMEGHLSHHLPADAVIVLRTEPVALRKRLGQRKKYLFEKVRENANAEALDVILVESVEKSDRVFEINTTEATVVSVVKSVVSIIDALKKGRTPQDFLPGKINWIEQIEL